MSKLINQETIQKFDVPGPRYTSYPTAPIWSDAVNADVYLAKLNEFRTSQKTLSLYVHIPFCKTLCRFCACNVVIRKNERKYGDEYLRYLFKEIDLVINQIEPNRAVKQLHWGGGTPNFLTVDQMETLYAQLNQRFEIDPDGEIAIEIDPRTVTLEKLECLKRLGFNRISMGVQDFTPKVQEAINRIQPFEHVKECYENCRNLGFKSINFDLVYGLPLQTRDSFRDTIEKVISLKPDRIALYSFAYVPWIKKHQTNLNVEDLPDHQTKVDLFLNSRDQFLSGGYQAIAMDHFALKDDELARSFNAGILNRNFMGYTVKPADEFIGFGVTSIGFIQNTFIQNVKTIPQYYESLDQDSLPVERGKELSQDDTIRRFTINSLMCHFRLDKKEFQRSFEIMFDHYFKDEQGHLSDCVRDGLIELSADEIKVTELGKIFIRNVCMGFDYYLKQKDAHRKFSQTI